MLDRVFGNIYDFGQIFARAKNSVPNVYGPITMQFGSRVFSQMTDIQITPMTIGKYGESWRSAAVSTTRQLDELLAGDGYGSAVAPGWQACELSCSNTALPLDHLEGIIVEPIQVEGVPLHRLVAELVAAAGLNTPVVSRAYRNGNNLRLLQELVETCAQLPRQEEEAFAVPDQALPPAVQDIPADRRHRVSLWCRYFTFGTLVPIRVEQHIAAMDEADDRTLCEQCDPGEDRGPALVSYHPYADDEEFAVGSCDWCAGLAIRCEACGVVTSIGEYQYGGGVECEGGCGATYVVERNTDKDGVSDVALTITPGE